MSLHGLSSLMLFSLHVYASPILKRQDSAFTFDGDAPFSVPITLLADALTCPNGFPSSSSPPVLLVHGTSATGEESWRQGYVPALLANGYTACYVTLPHRALSDMQVSSEFVAYNLHHLSELSGGLQTSVISHSQGGPVTQWALQFWPSTWSVTSSFVALSPDFAGIDLLGSSLSNSCIGNLYQVSIWQQSAGSKYYNALHAKNFHAQVPTTVIWSHTDEVVVPAEENASLVYATVLAVQDLCPLRPTDHIFMTVDPAGFNLALDALNNNGSASVARVVPHRLGICLHITAEHMDVGLTVELEGLFKDVVKGYLLGGERVSAEPPLMPYAASIL